MLDFSQATEGQTSASDKNVLNIPYTDSEEDLESVEGEVPEQAALEEAPFSPEVPDLEIPEASTRKVEKSASRKIKKLEKEVRELKLLERVVKSKNESIK